MSSNNNAQGSSEKRFLWIGPGLALILAVMIFTLGYWLLDRSPPMVAVSGVFSHWEDENQRVGHVIWRGIRKRSCPGTIYRYIVDGEIVTLNPREMPYSPVDESEDDPTTWDAPFIVPDHITHDASYRNRIEFRCNPLHKYMPIVVSPPDVPFKLPDHLKNPHYVAPGSASEDIRIEPSEGNPKQKGQLE